MISEKIDALATVGLSLQEIEGMKLVREVALRFMRAKFHRRPLVGSRDKSIDYCGVQIEVGGLVRWA